MTKFTQLLISGNFASGVTYYQDYYSSQENIARVVLTVTVEERLTVEAVLDTGAPWCILDPAIVEQLDLAGNADYEPDGRLMIRGTLYAGRLLRMRIDLRDEYEENDLEIEATVFVPTLAPGETWLSPNFIGLDGFLNRIRFAVDPAENAFYFGPLD